MELVNFTIADDMGTLSYEGRSFDLHNTYQFVDLSYRTRERVVEMIWRRGSGSWVDPEAPSSLALVFEGVSLCKVRERVPEMPVTEDACLSIVGFLGDDQIQEMDSWASTTPSDGCSHMVLAFMSGMSVKIGAEKVRLVVALE